MKLVVPLPQESVLLVQLIAFRQELLLVILGLLENFSQTFFLIFRMLFVAPDLAQLTTDLLAVVKPLLSFDGLFLQ